MRRNNKYYWFHNDHLGTPQKVTTGSGAVVWNAKYSSFGKAIIEIETVENNLRFPGQYYDSETGLHYNRYRYYNSMIGRYFRIDPVHHFNGDDENIPYILFFLLKTPTALHNYNYANNDPVNFIDPEGLFANIVIGAIAGGIGGAVSGLTNGNMVSAVIGGVSGAIIGGLVGTVNPFGSSAAGAIAGSWVAGVIGGFGGGAYSGFYNWATDPCASASDVIGSANEGAIGSGLVGLYTSPFGYYAEAASGSVAATAFATESIGMPLGLVTSPFIPEGGVFVGK
jgi:RHS repeat-associated protein